MNQRIVRGMRLWVLVAMLVGSGASCPRAFRRGQVANPAPIVFLESPSLAEITRVINENTSRVYQLQTTSATLSASGVPSLRTSLALELPRRLRIRAGIGLGTELDLGSNDEMFWMWAKRNDPPAVYVARHSQFQSAAAGRILPVPPSWFIDALGLLTLDPNATHDGPFLKQPGQLEIRSTLAGTGEPLYRTLVVDAQYGWILEQHLLDGRGQLLASAVATQHRHDPVNNISLPRKITVSLPPAELNFTLQVEDYLVNQLQGDPLELWAVPRLDGYPFVDLNDPSLGQLSQQPVTVPVYRGQQADPAELESGRLSGREPIWRQNRGQLLRWWQRLGTSLRR